MFAEIITHDLRKPLRKRLADRKFCGPYRWTPAKPGSGRGFYQASSGLSMDAAGSSFDLRLEHADMFLFPDRSRPTAYWADQYGNDALDPIVARLPKGRGFLAGWSMGRGMCAALDADIYATKEDAAYAAHSKAECAAEEMRNADETEEEV